MSDVISYINVLFLLLHICYRQFISVCNISVYNDFYSAMGVLLDKTVILSNGEIFVSTATLYTTVLQ